MPCSYRLLLDSKDRTRGDAGSFRLQVYPRDTRINGFSLEWAYIPFRFKNVTELYGDVVYFTFFVSVAETYSVEVILPHYYMTITQIIAYINDSVASQLDPLVISPVLSLSPYNNHIQMTITGTATANPIRFSSIVDPLGRNHVFRMLGLPVVTADIGIFNGGNTIIFPYSFTQEVPFRYILIHFLNMPTLMSNSAMLSSTFFIDITSYRPFLSLNGAEAIEGTPVVYDSLSYYPQVLDVSQYGPLKLPELEISLTDSNGKPLIEHIENEEWTMCIKLNKEE